MKNISRFRPEKSLISILPKKSGRNSTGKITARHQGGREKRYYREIDWRRNKFGIPGQVNAIEYDPNRNVDIALIHYQNGEKRYILLPVGLKIGDTVISGEKVELKPGNSLLLKNIPVGQSIHNIELFPGRGGQMVRGAGSLAILLAREGEFVHVKLPSGEIRKINENCYATIGQLATVEWKKTPIGSAGRARHMGRRPKVRGTAQDPRSHPHGGGEGRSGEGLKQAKTPWGKPARGLKTRKKKKFSDRYIIQRRK